MSAILSIFGTFFILGKIKLFVCSKGLETTKFDWTRKWKRLYNNLSLWEVTAKSYGRKTKNFLFFPRNWHFWPKLAFFLAKTGSKHLILGETDQRKWLQKSWGLNEVTDKSYDQKTKNFHFGRNVDSSFTFNFFGDLLEPSTLLQSLFWSFLLRISCF